MNFSLACENCIWTTRTHSLFVSAQQYLAMMGVQGMTKYEIKGTRATEIGEADVQNMPAPQDKNSAMP